MKDVLGIIGTNKILSLIKGGLNSKEDNMVEVPESIISNEWNQNNTETQEILIAPEGEINKWEYTIEGNNVLLNLYNHYNFDENNNNILMDDVIVYDRYIKDGIKYKSKIANSEENKIRFLFYSNAFIKSIIFGKYIDTSEMYYMNYAFSGCSSLTEINGLENLDTSNVISMRYTFSDTSLESLDLSKWNVSNVTDIRDMFNHSQQLEYLDLSNFDNTKIESIDNIFNRCNKLKEIKGIENFNVSDVENFSSIFAGCSSLESLDLTSWDIRNAKKLDRMFFVCTNLKEILVSRDKWVIPSGYDTTDMFIRCGTDHVTYVD